uniref:SbsA Ig-like domain-containing protein n=1 Tax=Caulobacter sp. (strain K31) TaxID=366602 RepID=B0SXY1_CAUSK
MRVSVLALTLCLATGPALAQAPGVQTPAPRPSREEPTPVSPVTVMPPTATPKVVTTWPATGQEIAPGVLVLKVVFDQQMTPRDFAYGLGAGADALNCLKTPRLLNDNKTFVLLCTTLPGKTYVISLNKEPTAAPTGFSNLAENRAAPSQLSFATGTGEPVTKLRDAIRAAGLGDLDVPVEEAPRLVKAP